MLDDFHRSRTHFWTLTEEINTSTPGGKLIFHIFAALAEFERGLIIERTGAWMKAARARGVRPGPKPKLSRQQIDPARKLIDNGHRREDVADLFKVGALHKPKTRVRGRWSNNVYHLQTISALKIFDKVENSTVSGFPDKAPRHSTASTDTVMTDTVGTDTNQMQRLTRRLNVNDLEKAALKRGERQQTVSDSEFQAALERRMLITDILNVCGDQHSRGFYNMVVQKVPAELVRAALSETKYRGAAGQIRKSKGAFFTDGIRRMAKARGIDLKLNLPRGERGAISSR